MRQSAGAEARKGDMTAPGEKDRPTLLEPETGAHRSDAGSLRGGDTGSYRGRMSLRTQALQEFDLPAAPQRIDDFPPSAPDADFCRVHAPAGQFLLLCAATPL